MTTPDALEQAFREHSGPSVRVFSGIGPRITRALSPEAIDQEPPEEPDPLADPDTEPGVFSAVPVLPWLGFLPLAEAAEMLTIDGFAEALALVLEPPSGLWLYDLPWRAQVRLLPERWLLMSVALLSLPSSDVGPGRHGALYLGLRALPAADQAAVVVLPGSDGAGRDALLRLLDIDASERAAALEDRIAGRLR